MDKRLSARGTIAASIAAAVVATAMAVAALVAGGGSTAWGQASEKFGNVGGPNAASVTAAADYAMAASIKVGGDGGWDYATLKEDGRVMYVTRTTHTQVVDVASGKLIHDIQGQQGAHGVVLVPSAGRGFISDGKAGDVVIFDLKSRAVIGKVAAAEGADAIIYDHWSKRVLVFCGEAKKMIAIAPDVNPNGGQPAASVDLDGTPEYAVADEKGKVFVNIVDQDQVAVVDTRAMKVIARWPTAPGARPTGLSMDREHGRLFVGCRNQKLVVMNADNGKVIADFPIGAFVDATAFRGGLAFASCGDGTLTIIREVTPDKFEIAQVLKTELGARTMAVDPVGAMLYLPTADLRFAPGSTASKPRPVPVPGTFRILVVAQTGGGGM